MQCSDFERAFPPDLYALPLPSWLPSGATLHWFLVCGQCKQEILCPHCIVTPNKQVLDTVSVVPSPRHWPAPTCLNSALYSSQSLSSPFITSSCKRKTGSRPDSCLALSSDHLSQSYQRSQSKLTKSTEISSPPDQGP